jgi:hypothetical protein
VQEEALNTGFGASSVSLLGATFSRFLENLVVENYQEGVALEVDLLEHPAMLHGAT